MVRRAHLQNVSGITRAVGATAPSGSASSLPELQIANLPPERLRRSPNNARTHSKKQLKQIVRSIERFGFVNPVLISDDCEIIAGHGRVEAAKMLGLKEMATVRLSNLSPAERRAYMITDNRLAELAGWDRDLLASELKGLLELQFDDIELTGFSLGEIDDLLDEAAENKAEQLGREDELPPNSLQGPAVSRTGDLWVLGPRRLLCGDARDLTSYQFLLEGKQADLVLTDGPFNVAIEGKGCAHDRVGERNIAAASAEMSEDQFIALLTAFLQRTKENAKDGAILFVFTDWRHLYELITASREVGLALKNIVVWAKAGTTGATKGSVYRCRYQLVLVFKNGDAPGSNAFELGQHSRRTNIWEYAAVGSLPASEDGVRHPPAKPTALVADAIRDVTGRGAIVLDPFVGTGTTIIAAEQTGRQGRAIEHDPRYCDIIPAMAAIHRQGGTAGSVGSDLCGGGSEPPYSAKHVHRPELRGSLTCPKKPIPHSASRWPLRPTDRRANRPKRTRLAPVAHPRTSGGRKAVRRPIPAVGRGRNSRCFRTSGRHSSRPSTRRSRFPAAIRWF
jgi:DNA modification methylase